MTNAPTITFRGLGHSVALDADIRARIAKLEVLDPRIVNCRVLLEVGRRHLGRGNRCHVRIDLTVPGREIVISHGADLHATQKDGQVAAPHKSDQAGRMRTRAHVAIREAFEAARRQIHDVSHMQRHEVKRHAPTETGRIIELSPVDEFGYIEAHDGHDVYFQKSSVLNGAFDRLRLGSLVAFAEERGAKGPQASTVKLRHARREGHS